MQVFHETKRLDGSRFFGLSQRATGEAPFDEEGICLDDLSVGPSTLPQVGKGAFAKRRFGKGDVISTSPVLAVDRSQMEIVHQFQNDHGQLQYTEEVIHQNLLLNYAMGHPNSTVLLLPYGPGVNYINHKGGKEANVILDWSDLGLMDLELLGTTAHECWQTNIRTYETTWKLNESR